MRGLGAALSVLAVLGFPGAVVPSHGSAPASYEPGELLVRFEPGVSQRRALEATGARVVERLPLSGLVLVKLEPETPVVEAEAAFERRPDVRYAEPNHRYSLSATPNDLDFGQLWGLHNTGQPVNGSAGTADADIDAPEAWNTTTGSADVTVAVVDTGAELTHPDLALNLVPGWDFVENDATPQDMNGHGTHVAGTIGARGHNTTGVTGVNWNVKLMPIRVVANSVTTDAAIVQGFDHACAAGAKVVNGSFSGYQSSIAVHEAIARCPAALFVFAAGNGGNNNDVLPRYPCNDPSPNVLCVAASDSSDELAWFSPSSSSNYGLSVDLAAPGKDIYSTYPPSSYEFLSGTSMASPHAAGAAALVLAARPGLTPVQVRQALRLGVDQKPSLNGLVDTGGRLNVAQALTQDVFPPSTPSLGGSTPVGAWTNTTSATVSWSGATDPAGVDGYSFAWSPDPGFVPQASKNAEENVTTTTATLPDGQQWFHLRVTDALGNWSDAVHLGPFLIDTFPPVRPTLSSSTHRAGVASATRTVVVNWAGVGDSLSGLDGFSFAWSRQRVVPVDLAKDAEEGAVRTTGVRLVPGSWWFGIRARDNAGNWSDVVTLGPFVLKSTPPVCSVPRLRGLTLVGAKRQLTKRGCALGRLSRTYSRRVRRGRVIAQKPGPGLRLRRGAKIAVVLSRGRRR